MKNEKIIGTITNITIKIKIPTYINYVSLHDML
jgi:hypothetical protein